MVDVVLHAKQHTIQRTPSNGGSAFKFLRRWDRWHSATQQQLCCVMAPSISVVTPESMPCSGPRSCCGRALLLETVGQTTSCCLWLFSLTATGGQHQASGGAQAGGVIVSLEGCGGLLTWHAPAGHPATPASRRRAQRRPRRDTAAAPAATASSRRYMPPAHEKPDVCDP